ncbi:hypothetical protein MNBD_ALPHA12-1549 [hydrothermal vent metagenome]|uniref:Porin domain-containing protein n=1 Tax=hydrothermal vent metagenome TaxID=652676 RepID=A0A3B0TSM4_9ZZZZ
MLRLLTSASTVKFQGRSLSAFSRSGSAKGLLAAMALLLMPAATASDNISASAAEKNRPPAVIIAKDRLFAGTSATEQNPGENIIAPFKLDWSLGLRGSYKNGSGGTGYEAVIVPDISLTYSGLRGQYILGSQASLAYNQDQTIRIKAGQLTASGQYRLDRESQLSARVSARISQDDPDAPGMENIIKTPLVLDLEGQAGIVRQFSRLGLELKGSISRRVMSQTILAGNVVQDNSSLNTTRLGVSMRASYNLTPIISAFMQGDMAQNWFDAASPVSGFYQNGLDLKGAIGLVGNWRGIFGAQISAGYGLRRFDDPGVLQLASVLYGLDLSWSPNQTLSAGARFSSTINPENTKAGAPAFVSYTANGNIGFALSSTFALRASAAGNWLVPTNGAETSVSYSAGAGANYKINRQTDLNLDYLYTKIIQPPVAAKDQQAITLGVNFSR